VNLVLLGPPGAGKGTQAARICEAFSLVHLSSGDILRAERKAQSELGKKAQSYMDSGGLVPDDLIIAMMMDHISRPEAVKRGFLLDGFPRTVVQAQQLDEKLTARQMKVDAVVNMDVDDAEVTRRLTGRWSCPKDGRIYHEVFTAPKKKGLCDDCGTALTRRKDDEPGVVRERLRTYHELTAPLAEYYEKRGVLRTVDGGGAADDVFARIRKVCRA
jgi:adenylate kinase